MGLFPNRLTKLTGDRNTLITRRRISLHIFAPVQVGLHKTVAQDWPTTSVAYHPDFHRVGATPYGVWLLDMLPLIGESPNLSINTQASLVATMCVWRLFARCLAALLAAGIPDPYRAVV